MTEPDRTRRVLVEHQNPLTLARVAEAVRAAGLEVDTCSGPSRLPDRTCPMTTGKGCDKAARADVVVCGLPLEDIGIFIALRRGLPDTEIVLTLSERDRACLSMSGVIEQVATVVPRDASDDELRAAVRSPVG